MVLVGQGDCGRKGSGLRGNIDGGGGLDGPRGTFFDVLRMVGKASIDPLQKSVSLARGDVEGEIATGRVKAGVKLAANQATFGRRRRDGTVNGRAVDRETRRKRYSRAIWQDDLVETDLGNAEGREVAAESGVNATLAVGEETDNSAGKDSAPGQQELVAGVDGIKEVCADWLACAHGVMAICGEGQRRAGRDRAGRGLA